MKKGLFAQYVKLKLMVQLRALHGEIFLHVLLRLIDISKKILINSIENGQIAHISDELSVDHLPQSFRFYDPIIVIIKAGISQGALESIDLKQKMVIERSSQFEVFCKKYFDHKYVDDSGSRTHHKYPIVKYCNQRDLNPTESKHAMCLQSSRYLSIHLEN